MTTPRKQYNPPLTVWAINHLNAIYPVEIVAETPCAVWIKSHTSHDWRNRPIPPRLAYKKSLLTFHDYHEAKAALLHRLQREVDLHRLHLTAAQKRLEEAELLMPPAPQANG